ncbi:MAG: T9SS type A sorting domain-containing protein [Candidatus Latescibacteria bacterium]|nr:T9SS type A sorting domain-containing protein [Candidatus Latescibacterota bacterium]
MASSLFFCLLLAATSLTAQESPAASWKAKTNRKVDGSAAAIAPESLSHIGRQLQRFFGAPPRRKAAASPAPTFKPVNLTAARQLPGWRMGWHQDNGTPVFVAATTRPAGKIAVPVSAQASQLQAFDFLAAHTTLFRLQRPRDELQVATAATDAMGHHHIAFQQQAAGVPLWGHDLVVHSRPDGTPYAVNGRYAPTLERVPSAAVVDADQAILAATAHLAQRRSVQSLEPALQQLLDYTGPSATAYLWSDPVTGLWHRVWQVEIRPDLAERWFYFIDAHTGAVLQHYNATASDGPATAQALGLHGDLRTIQVYEVDDNFFMLDASRPSFQDFQPDILNNPLGAIFTLDARNRDLSRFNLARISSPDNSWSDPVAVSAHANAGRVFDYYLDTHNRLGIDGLGSTLISIVHVTNDGRPMDNAFWNGAVIAYGDGASVLNPLAGALDVAAHEMTHGVIERTVGLEYQFQSGALNESFADVFGAMVDRDDWLLGEDVVRPGIFPSGALRNIAEPNNGGRRGDFFWQPAHMDEFVELSLDQDNGGVHINSGIPNRAAFLIAQAIGREKTEQIYYRVLAARYLNRRAEFADMRRAAQQAAADLFGEGSQEVAAVDQAFDGVGIFAAGAEPEPEVRVPVQGEEWIALINAEPGDNSLLLVRPDITSQADIVQLTSTQVFTNTGNPIAHTADGGTILFIDQDNFIRAIRPDGRDEAVISELGIWSSIALSPDGARLAATTVERDSTVFIFDLADPNNNKRIRLYNPTTQEGVRAYVTRFADALDWDQSGGFLLYDAFNSIPQEGGEAIEYWTINLLDVDSETVLPLFPAQPEGISIGNPSFAQTNDNAIIFDLVQFQDGIDSPVEDNQIWAADLFSGAIKLLVENGPSIGYPRYSPDDSRLIFERLEGGETTLRRIPLEADRITASGPSQFYARQGQRPTWLVLGGLPTAVEEESGADTPVEFALEENFPNPFNSGTTIRFAVPETAPVRLTLFNLAGQQVATLARGVHAAGAYALQWDGRDDGGRAVGSGVYLYRLEAGGQVATRKLLLVR